MQLFQVNGSFANYRLLKMNDAAIASGGQLCAKLYSFEMPSLVAGKRGAMIL
jgi:hypothetical protein